MSGMKFVSNDVNACVNEMFQGFQCIHPNLTFDPEKKIVISNGVLNAGNRVCVLSGGGAGHEHFSAGYVGRGMLSGAVSGLIFASPPSQNILSAIRTLAKFNNDAGILLIVLNYTGDILNFGLAAEEAESYDIKLEIVVVSEDCSKIGSDVSGAGRRGMCGSVFVFKIAGYLAEKGDALNEIAQICREINDNMATIGAVVRACRVPGVGLLFEMGENDVEIGVGVHGEAGTSREKFISLDDLIGKMCDKLISALKLVGEKYLCVLINNLGSVSQLEMGIITGKVRRHLQKAASFVVYRIYAGSFMTSLDANGFQISVLDATRHPEWISALDAPADASAWPNRDAKILPYVPIETTIPATNKNAGPKFAPSQKEIFRNCLRNAAAVLLAQERKLNELDGCSGDGDTGSTMARLAAEALKNLEDIAGDYPAVAMQRLSHVATDAMGGTSGGVYGILLASAGKFFGKRATLDWPGAWKYSLDTLTRYSPVRIGDRTMVDVLLPAYEEFKKQLSENREETVVAFEKAVNVGRECCERTKNMKPRLGRASYVASTYINDVDPGAYAVVLWLQAILSTLLKSREKLTTS